MRPGWRAASAAISSFTALIVSCGTRPSVSAINASGMLTTRAAISPSRMSCKSSASSESLRASASQRGRWLAGNVRSAVCSKRAGTK